MDRITKIEVLKAIAAGEANIFDLLAGDGQFIKMGGYYVKDGTRYTEQQLKKIKASLTRQGKKLNGISSGDSLISKQFIEKYTKAF